jgi:EpsI family protein
MSPLAARAGFVAILLMLTSVATATLTPRASVDVIAPDLDSILPDQFGAWRRIALSNAVLPQEVELGPGEAVAYRAYADDLGRVVTLVAAYGPPLGDSVRLHRPESCYVAQGFTILDREESEIDLDGKATAIVNLWTQSPSRREAVSYWLRNGPAFTTRAAQSQWFSVFRESRKPLDGALVRVSTVNGRDALFDLHRDFLIEFATALPPEGKALLLGGGAS